MENSRVRMGTTLGVFALTLVGLGITWMEHVKSLAIMTQAMTWMGHGLQTQGLARVSGLLLSSKSDIALSFDVNIEKDIDFVVIRNHIFEYSI